MQRLSLTNRLKKLLADPNAPQLADLDSVDATHAHRDLVRNKKVLWTIYRDDYQLLGDVIARAPPGPVVEIGSGPALSKEFLPQVITSDVVALPEIDLVFPGERMPLESESISVFFLHGVFHHIPDVVAFLREAERCLIPGGRVFMIEPHNTPWRRFMVRHFHHEPLDPKGSWTFERGNEARLTKANQALPWIVFIRDRNRFQREFPDLIIRRLQPHAPFQYVFSGGMSYRALIPPAFWWLVRAAEKMVSPLGSVFGYFLLIELEKKK